jgi:hypothetical protein
MNYKEIAEIIIGLKNADLEFRDKLIQSGQLSDGYNEEMKELHNRNAKTLNEIIDKIGYPTTEKVGKEASEATWLCKLPQKSDSLKIERILKFKLYEKDKIYREPDHQST